MKLPDKLRNDTQVDAMQDLMRVTMLNRWARYEIIQSRIDMVLMVERPLILLRWNIEQAVKEDR